MTATFALMISPSPANAAPTRSLQAAIGCGSNVRHEIHIGAYQQAIRTLFAQCRPVSEPDPVIAQISGPTGGRQLNPFLDNEVLSHRESALRPQLPPVSMRFRTTPRQL